MPLTKAECAAAARCADNYPPGNGFTFIHGHDFTCPQTAAHAIKTNQSLIGAG